jgi:hypothetical protein
VEQFPGGVVAGDVGGKGEAQRMMPSTTTRLYLID